MVATDIGSHASETEPTYHDNATTPPPIVRCRAHPNHRMVQKRLTLSILRNGQVLKFKTLDCYCSVLLRLLEDTSKTDFLILLVVLYLVYYREYIFPNS